MLVRKRFKLLKRLFKNQVSSANANKILPVILCGGRGSRVAEITPDFTPKQFLKQRGSNQNLLQTTIDRVKHPVFSDCPVLFTHIDFQKFILESAGGMNVDIFMEPVRRNSAAPVIMSAIYAAHKHYEYILVLPSDHIIENVNAFHGDILSGLEMLRINDFPVIYFGIKPNRADTGFGYIKKHVSTQLEFIEKPELLKAMALIKDGALWNSGIFLISVSPFLEDIQNLHPGIYNLALSISLRCSTFPIEKFKHFPDISFDKFYCERSTRGGMVEAHFDWCDIGSPAQFKLKGIGQ